MSEVAWSEEATEAPRKKRRIPPWVLWGCGCGCLVALILAGILVVVGVRIAKEAADPEIAWARVDELLPFEQRPEGCEVGGLTIDILGFGQYHLQPPGEPFLLLLQRMPSKEAIDRWLDPDSRENQGIFGVNKIHEAEPGTIEVQGREVPALRCKAWLPEKAHDRGAAGASIRLDLSSANGPPIQLQIIAADGRDRVEDADVARLLAPFEVWQGR
jgi:hypothetical protein